MQYPILLCRHFPQIDSFAEYMYVCGYPIPMTLRAHISQGHWICIMSFRLNVQN